MLHLLIHDPDIGDYYYHGCFEDTQHGLDVVRKIVGEEVGYKLIRGEVIATRNEIEEDYYDCIDTN